jgi:hypothetical protein
MVAACNLQKTATPSGPNNSTTPVGAGSTTEPTPIQGLVESEMETGEAKIESVQATIMESSPLMVVVQITGSFPDGCTQISRMSQTVDGTTIKITVFTARPKDMACTDVITQFEQKLPLDTTELQPGTYTIDVNGVTTQLDLTSIPSGDTGAGSPCPIASEGTKLFKNDILKLCFLYPDSYILDDTTAGTIILNGSVFNVTDKEVTVSLILMTEAANNRDTTTFANEKLASVESGGAVVVRGSIQLNGINAVTADGVPGPATLTRQIFYVNSDMGFNFTLTPIDPAFEQQTKEAETLWQMVSTTLTFFQ